ncbi:MAG: hypothetical protein AVDCRST_MAG85-185, partial [uncultured Solirubrobacteraceae bacterium]
MRTASSFAPAARELGSLLLHDFEQTFR